MTKNKRKLLRIFVFLRINKISKFITRLFLLPFLLALNSIEAFSFKNFFIRFSFFFILNFFWDKYLVEASIRKGEEIRNKNRIKRRQQNKNTNS